VTLVGDLKTLAKVQREYGTNDDDNSKIANGNYDAMAYPGWPNTSVQTRASLVFIEPKMKRQIERWQKRIVFHEMMHLVGRSPRNEDSLALKPTFLAAYAAAKQRFTRLENVAEDIRGLLPHFP
jgi:hypothetical protein